MFDVVSISTISLIMVHDHFTLKLTKSKIIVCMCLYS